MPTLPPTLARELDQAIDLFGLGKLREVIEAHASECLALIADGDDDYSSVGTTRFGGDPDLPVGVDWPASGDPEDAETVYSNFVGQINFAELPRLATGSSLPERGVLFLFIRSIDSAFDPVVYDSVFYAGGPNELERRESPDIERLADDYIADLNPVRIRAEPAISIASYRKPLREALKAAGSDTDMAFHDLTLSLQRKQQIGQLLGHANAGDVRVDLYRKMLLTRIGKAELHYNDYWDSLTEYEAAIAFWRDRGDHKIAASYEQMRPGVNWLQQHRDELAAQLAPWRLLLRLDSNDAMGLNFLDADPIYVFARDTDLAVGNFDDLPGQVTQG